MKTEQTTILKKIQNKPSLGHVCPGFIKHQAKSGDRHRKHVSPRNLSTLEQFSSDQRWLYGQFSMLLVTSKLATNDAFTTNIGGLTKVSS